LAALGVLDDAPVPPAFVIEHVERRGRLSVAFRLLLVLPQVIALEALALVGSVVALLGWFAALVLGRLPEPFARYLCHLTRYSARVYAYAWLLTDRYPPFRLSAEDYPVRVELAPGRLNRWAVLFRLVLAIPASVLASLALAGWLVAGFVIWLVVLVAGRVPGPLFDATTAVLRYSIRYNAYLWLVTAAYPWGLFGDRPAMTGPPPPETAAGPGPAGAPAEVPSAEVPSGEAPLTGPAGAPEPPPAGAPEPPARPGLLVLSTGAKRLVVLFIALGVLQSAGGSAVSALTVGNTVSRTEARSAVTTANDNLAAHGQRVQQQISACGSAADQLACVEAADRELADAFAAFATELRRIEFPGSARDEAAELTSLADRIAGTLREVAAAGSPEEYTRLAAGIPQLVNSFDPKGQALLDALTG